MRVSKDLKKIMAEYKAKGWQIEPTNKGHSKWKAPDGKTIVIASGTPSCRFALANHVGLLERAERQIAAASETVQ
jgi:hypothetical protein